MRTDVSGVSERPPGGPVSDEGGPVSLERVIADIWGRLIAVENVRPKDRFFDLGGSSLIGLQFVAHLRRALNVELPATVLYEAPTVEAMAAYVENLRRASAGASQACVGEAAAAGFGAASVSPQTGIDAHQIASSRKVPAASVRRIAIVGMSGRFPGAKDVRTLWKNLVEGKESITFLSDDQLLANGVSSEDLANPRYVRAVASIPGIDEFDADFFGYSPREAELLDPQHRVFLECAVEALEEAGESAAGAERVGVFAGSSLSTYLLGLLSLPDLKKQLPPLALTIANHADSLATKVSYKLNLTGPSVSVQSFCSTSAVATHMACRSLLSGDCDIALAGGARIVVDQEHGYVWEPGGVDSPDGHCRAFDKDGKGALLGNGVAILVLKRLEDAVRDGNRIYAVIIGSAVNNDGGYKSSYTAPSVRGQSQAVVAALREANVPAETIQFLEAHGTATELGDPIEVAALNKAYRQFTQARQFCAIGSVKSNLGHLDRAAGATGLIKAALSLYEGRIPANLNFREPNPRIDFAASPFFVNTELRRWERSREPRRAAVNSLGVGGTNAHFILEEAPATFPSSRARPWNLLLLSASSQAALDAARANLADYLESEVEVNLSDVAFTLQVGRRAFEYRCAVVCSNREDAICALRGERSEQVIVGNATASAATVAFIFSGVGDHYLGMASGLYGAEPVYRRCVEDCCALLKREMGLDLLDALREPPSSNGSTGDALERMLCGTRDLGVLADTEAAQPAVFVLEYALGRLLQSWGVVPDALIGYSLGEYTAAALSGVFTAEDALRLVATRARLIGELPAGAMLAVPLAENALAQYLTGDLSIGIVNGPRMCVVSGPVAAIEALQKQLQGQGIVSRPSGTRHAFHSSMMEPVVEPLMELMGSMRLSAPRIPILSNVTGGWLQAAEATSPRYWGRHLRETVQFGRGIERLLEKADRALVEVGPGQSLSSLVRLHPAAAKTAARVITPTCRAVFDAQTDQACLLKSLGKLWVAGVAPDWKKTWGDDRRARVSLPSYPFQRQLYWIDIPKVPAPGVMSAAAGRKQADIADWFWQPVWKRRDLPEGGVHGAQEGWLIVGAAAPARALGDALREARQLVVVVEHGTSFASLSQVSYRINPGEVDDYEALFRALRAGDLLPGRVVHLGGTAPRDSFYSVLRLVQCMGRHRWTQALELDLISTGSSNVTGREEIDPENTLLLGPCRVIPQEYPNLICRSIDVEPYEPDPRSPGVRLLVRELLSRQLDIDVAWRSGTRYVQDFEALRLPPPAPQQIGLKHGGVYLITGGLGGVGLIVAGYLAREWKAHLVLTGRTQLPARADWDAWLAGHAEQDRVSQKIQRIRALEQAGGTVLACSADVADEVRMAEVVAEVRRRLGRIHGVFHAAGLVSMQALVPIQHSGREACESHFRPKVEGARVLERLLASEPADFYVLFASLSSVLGGIGFAAYAAANQFLNSFASRQQRAGGPLWCSINWDTWETRTPVAAAEAPSRPRTTVAEFAMSPEEGIEALMRAMASRKGCLVHSTGELRARREQWVSGEFLHLKRRPNAQTRRVLYQRPSLANPFVESTNDSERRIANVYRTVLGIEQIGSQDNFFDMGGTSLSALQVAAGLQAEFGIAVSPVLLFEAPTVAKLARHLVPDTNAVAQDDEALRRELERRRALSSRAHNEPIAIIGMSGRFPGAGNVEELWRNLVSGIESLARFTDDELRGSGVPPEVFAKPNYVRVRSILSGIDQFDAAFFGYTPREAEFIDPQHRLFLECAWEALEDAGYDAQRHEGPIGVFAGTNFSSYGAQLLANAGAARSFVTLDNMIAHDKDSLTTVVSYKLDLRGPSVAVQTFCSTSLVAVHLACQSLRSGESDMALAGGVSIRIPEKVGYEHSPGGQDSIDGHTRSFDAQATGTVFGDGVAVITLKRLDAALADGDTIRAVIRGSAINNDGALKAGYTAPSVAGQAAVVAAAMAAAGVHPQEVSYVEAHGSATELGDPIEVAALNRAYRLATGKRGYCALGSVKSNFGHLDRAAGVAGLIKVVKSLEREAIPPSLHFTTPNPQIDFLDSPFYVNRGLVPWPRGGQPRIAGVNALGIGGTNVHVVLEEAPATAASAPGRQFKLLPLSARTPGALNAMAENLACHMERHPEQSLADIAHTLQEGRRQFRERMVVLCDDRRGAIALLRDQRELRKLRGTASAERSVAFVFPEVAPQDLNMGSGLYEHEPVFRAAMDECHELQRDPDRHLGVFAVQYSLAKLLMSWGIVPAVLVGRGVGEFVAATIKGTLSLEDALHLAASRTQRIHELPPGGVPEVAHEELLSNPDRVLMECHCAHDLQSLLAAAGKLWAHGAAIDWRAFTSGESRRRVPLPTYPFERQRYWIDTVPTAGDPVGKKPDVADWFYETQWHERPLRPRAAAASQLAHTEWLLLMDQGGVGRKLAARLRSTAAHVTTVEPSKDEAFLQTDAHSYRMRPGNGAHFSRLVRELRAGGRTIRRIVHLWNLTDETDFETLQQVGFFDLLGLVRALGENGVAEDIQLDVVSNAMYAVRAADPISAAKGTSVGAYRAIPLEYPNVNLRSIDLSTADPASPAAAVGCLFQELVSDAQDVAVAYRDGRRFVQAYAAVRLDAVPPQQDVLREGGTYLITGGLGNVGLTLAGMLTRRYRARVALVTRREFPQLEAWDAWLATHVDDDPTSQQIRVLRSMERAGGSIAVFAGDVADETRMREIFERFEARYGQVHGVFHAAGVISRKYHSIIAESTRRHVEAHFASKVHGTRVLARLLDERNADFCLLFSSLAATLGGITLSAYAAANAFQESFAASRRASKGTRWIAVNWDSWARETGEQDHEGTTLAEFLMWPEEGAEAVRRVLSATSARQWVNSTASLQTRLDQWVYRTQLRGKTAEAGDRTTHYPRPDLSTAYVAASSEAEKRIARVFQDILGIDKVGLEDNFFELGGNSLIALQIIAQLQRELGIQLSPILIFEAPSVRRLARTLLPAQQSARLPIVAERSGSAGARPRERARRRAAERSDIAIIGMAGRFPGAPDIATMWDSLLEGTESLTWFTDEELRQSGIDERLITDPAYIKARGIIDDIDRFDAGVFGFSPREAQLMDPQHRLMLETAWQTLEHAGYDSHRFDGTIGVFAGATQSLYQMRLHTDRELWSRLDGFEMNLANTQDSLATRISYKLDLKGPSLSIGTYCSTSGVAIHLACQSLRSGESEMALAGGVSLLVPSRRGHLFEPGNQGSPDGHTRAFDARAQGTVFSDGVAMLLLKRLEDALEDGDTIHALIRGTAINNDGSLKAGFTAPSVERQAEVISLALQDAGLTANDIQYVEAHGTATELGDPIEVVALTRAFRATSSQKRFCALGSIKTNFGHTDRAAGAIGVIKATQVLKTGLVPPTLHFERANPKIDLQNSPFFVTSRLHELSPGASPRRAGVTALGVGGTNAHIVLEQSPLVAPGDAGRSCNFLTLSARSPAALEMMQENLAVALESSAQIDVADAAFTLHCGRRELSERLAVVGRDREEFVRALRSQTPGRFFRGSSDAGGRPVAFLFPGVGEQFLNMAEDLYSQVPAFRGQMDQCFDLLQQRESLDLKSLLFVPGLGPQRADVQFLRGGTRASESAAQLNRTIHAQPAVFVVEYCLARLLMSWGVVPAALLGYSLGEFTAAALAGIFSLADAVALVAGRARIIDALPAGAMLAVPLSASELRPLLGPELSLGICNGPKLTVICGPEEPVAQLQQRLAEAEVVSRRLPAGHAFHSHMMQGAAQPLRDLLKTVELRRPSLRCLSNLTGTWLTDEEATDPEYWVRQMCETARFVECLDTLLGQEDWAAVEVGPGQSLSSMVRQREITQEGRAAPVVVSTMRTGYVEDDEYCVLSAALAKLWVAGIAPDWRLYYSGERRRRIPLPTYAYERQRYWLDPAAEPTLERPMAPGGRKAELPDFFYAAGWKPAGELASDLRASRVADRDRWLIFADVQGIAEPVVELARGIGVEAVLVRRGTAGFREADDGSFVVRASERDDYVAVLKALRRRNQLPRRIVHMWSAGQLAVPEDQQLPETLQAGFFSLMYLAQALGEQMAEAPMDLRIVSSDMQWVLGTEDIHPAKATVTGPCRVIRQEYANVACRSIDLSGPELAAVPVERIAVALVAEILSGAGDQFVAFREGKRWLPTLEPVRIEAPLEEATRLKREGVYFITGGLGGIGSACAEFLHQNYAARLVLVGRTALPPRDEWDEWCERTSDAPMADRIRKINRLVKAGAEVLIVTADVCDVEQMQSAVREAIALYGSIDGVFHAAGVPAQGLTQLKSAQSAAKVMAPKVQGTVALARAFADVPLDFMVLVSSLAALTGGGPGQIEYCAANAFLDAFALQRRSHASFTVAINFGEWQWDAWAEGLKGFQPEVRAALVRNRREYGITFEEGMEAIRRVLATDLPQIVVVTQDARELVALSDACSITTLATVVSKARNRHQPSYPRPSLATRFVAASSELERKVAGVWQRVLGIEQIGTKDNFFDLGGNSLVGLQIIAELRKELGAELSPIALYEAPTVDALVNYLAPEATPVARSTAQPLAERRARAREAAASGDIAIIGMSGRFPGADDIAQFWSNLSTAVESVTFYSDAELLEAGVSAEKLRNPNYVRAGYDVREFEYFDAPLFGYAPREAELIDPQHRQFLECAWQALEDAACDSETYPGLIGVFAGANTSTYLSHLLSLPEVMGSGLATWQAFMGNSNDSLATRVAYKLNLRGPALSVQTFCSTSGVAAHMACKSLLRGECDMALAGGVNIAVSGKVGYLYEQGGIESPDGHTRSFDAQAKGAVIGDGVGVVVLKRLEDALADGEHIYAVIKGSAVNNDGSRKVGYTAPSVDGQAAAISEALTVADVAADSIGYVEAHGTATELGDPIEVAALTKAFRAATDRTGYCALGSAKPNVGHLDRAAGVTGLIKTALSLHHELIPPLLHFRSPNPNIDFASSPFFVCAQPTQWPRGSEPRRGGVNVVGLGGTNAHFILEEAPEIRPSSPSRRAQLLLLSAKTQSALDGSCERLRAYLGAQPDVNLADVAYTLQTGRKRLEFRKALVCVDRDDAIASLATASSPGGLSSRRPAGRKSVVFMFAGVDDRYPDMAGGLYRAEPAFRAEVDRCCALLESTLGVDLRGSLFSQDAQARGSPAEPAVFVIEYCLARLLMSWGIVPQALVGHNVGGLVAATISGTLKLEDALRLVGTSTSPDSRGQPQCGTAHFVESVGELLKDKDRVFMEIGAGEALAAFIKDRPDCQQGAAQAVIPTLRAREQNQADDGFLLGSLARLWLAGVEPDWSAFYAAERRLKISLPTYPFERMRCWVEPSRPLLAAAEEIGACASAALGCRDESVSAEVSLAEQLRTQAEKAPLEDFFYWPSWQATGELCADPGTLKREPVGTYWLIFADEEGIGAALEETLRPLGVEAVLISQGEGFRALEDGSFRIRGSRKDDYAAVLKELRRRGRLPSRIVHLWTAQRQSARGADDPIELGFYSLFHLAQALGERFAEVSMELCIVSSDLEPVLGVEEIDPRKATLKGPCKVIRQEYENIACRSIDLFSRCDGALPADELGARLAVEILGGQQDQIVAFRQGRRWVPSLERVRIEAPLERTPRLRQEGVYLITGGLGGIGLAFAEYLYRSCNARLVLVGRSGLPPREQWEEICAQGRQEDRTTERVRKVHGLMQAGAQILSITADVTDAEQMDAAVREAVERFGTVNGVFHAAGLPGQGLTQLKTARTAAQVLAPKIQGTLALDRALAGAGLSLDFLILVSSLAALNGGGPGQIDYCAGNAFLDAFAQRNQGRHGMTVAINFGEWQWDAWSEGLKGYQPEMREALIAHRRQFGIAFEEGMEAIRRVLSIDVPQIIVLPEDAVATVAGSNICAVSKVSDAVRRTRERQQNRYPRPALATSFVPASDELERTIAIIWQDALGIDQVGIQDNFFDLGGNSLVGLQVVARINRDLDLAVDLRAIFELPTVAAQADMIRTVQLLSNDRSAEPEADLIEEVV